MVRPSTFSGAVIRCSLFLFFQTERKVGIKKTNETKDRHTTYRNNKNNEKHEKKWKDIDRQKISNRMNFNEQKRQRHEKQVLCANSTTIESPREVCWSKRPPYVFLLSSKVTSAVRRVCSVLLGSSKEARNSYWKVDCNPSSPLSETLLKPLLPEPTPPSPSLLLLSILPPEHSSS